MNTSSFAEGDWTSSSYSMSNAGECVEWAPAHAALTGEVLVRDSKTPHAPYLTLTPAGFAGLVAFAKECG
ncbi:DUF397 domain-containing protein [Streptomyces albidoflavus]|uniref:DUF397 domain-containing protein n=5 Tax=Streptomyces TaxID=1883 RepID=A0A126YA66_9ACTN|nr:MULTISPECIES: DUF397 domain-containing protein [Streptomyces diastaticus group]AGI89649.1 Hypothetical protein XNR_3306 [Streptomyces albidoflavus]AWL33087.1 DUF397 domain-containing protein [Streptomyces sp. SM17]KDR60213.1 hypothetical protein DC60_01580 [Streptomyces wadayamensis]MYX52255.1 DUF397 domain-containing protein [Streptomyces sp. SID8385]MYX87159.1 DUF397 domain-containing protein [Streptomyces sp. SID4915]PKA35917.1 DUF397 domain-containing protein [Streptomyces sp. SM8]SCD